MNWLKQLMLMMNFWWSCQKNLICILASFRKQILLSCNAWSDILIALCFYVQIQYAMNQKSDNYYHVIYLTQHIIQELIHIIFKKCQLNLAHVVWVLWIHANNLNVVIDDDVVCELFKKQDMIIKFTELLNNDSLKFNLNEDFLSSLFIVMKLIFWFIS